jgi:DNA phosphorothioation-associated putative methyltransferase
VFRDEQRRQAFLASRFSRPVRTFATATRARQAEAHHDVLEPVVAFLAARGRPPIEGELGLDNETSAAEAFGSLRRAARTALLITDPAALEHAQQLRRADLLVYLALGAFAGRGRLAELDASTRHDIKTFFQSYREACAKADRLLFAAGQSDAIELASRASTVGKLTPTALYVHTSAIGRVPAVLRVYEGCARVFIGTVEDANIIKLTRVEAAVSYLAYPDFDRDPHPALAESFHVDLHGLRARRHDYRSRSNPPILHRKEDFVADDYPRRATFARLTHQEERAGLYADTTRIGTREGWRAALQSAAVELRGHRLVTAKPS